MLYQEFFHEYVVYLENTDVAKTFVKLQKLRKKIMKKIISALTLVTFASFFLSAMAFAAGDKVAGAAIFKKNCAGCHGATGEGNGPAAVSLKPKPANFVNPAYKDSTGKNPKDYTDAELTAVISKGRKGTAMPTWKKSLSAAQISDVLAYERSLHK